MKIQISNLTFKAIIGILDFERIKKQKVIINLSFEYEFSKDKFIDYAEVSKLVKTTMKKEKFLLLEDAILHLENLLNTKYKIITQIEQTPKEILEFVLNFKSDDIIG